MNTRFAYASGEDIRLYDIVRTGHRRIAVVQQLIDPNTRISGLDPVRRGGVLLKENWLGVGGYSVVEIGDADWEDMSFVRRGSEDDLRADPTDS